MRASHLAVVWNPSKTTQEQLEEALRDAVADREAPDEVSWWQTSPDDPGQSATAHAIEAGADVVAAAGGDGTVRAVAEHLAEVSAPVELGIVPLGTGNLLARNLDVPLGDPVAAFDRLLVSGTARTIDVGWAEVEEAGGTQRCAFAVMAGFGIDAHMITETDDDLKEKAGWLAYVESLGRAVSASETIDVRMSVDEGRPHKERAHTVLIGNCGTLQGGVVLLPGADPADGALDMLLLSADDVAGWLDTLRTMVWDNGLKRVLSGRRSARSSDSVTHRRITALRVELAEPRVFEIDGEDLGETSRVVITVQPSALRVR